VITYVTDLEGRWDKLAGACAGNPHVSLVDGALVLAPGATFVFGGDAVDRGPAGRKLLTTLLTAKLRYGERVVLLAGNRDLNKLRLRRELTGHPRPTAPEALHRDRPALLRWIFSNTMGAREAFGHRATELASEGRSAGDEDVVDSFLEDLAPEGLHTTWLRAAQLAWLHGDTLFVHGGVTADNLGVVPGVAGRVAGVARWVDALNTFHANQLAAFVDDDVRDGVPAWSPLVAYQAPLPGTAANQASVVYGRLADAHNDPRLPEPSVVAQLLAEGVRRVVVGHTPVGDVPAVLRSGAFTLVMADNSYGRLEAASRVSIGTEVIRFEGRCRLDDGRELNVSAELGDAPSVVGTVTSEGRLVEAPVDDGYLTFRALPERRVEQQVVRPGPLSAPRSLPEPTGV
jgi:hypothetical protein